MWFEFTVYTWRVRAIAIILAYFVANITVELINISNFVAKYFRGTSLNY